MPTRPGCPKHPDTRIRRNGTASTQSGRLQKYLCKPAGDSPHSFTLPVAVPGTGVRRRPPRGHRYDAEVIAHALFALACGATYRQARVAALGGAAGTVDAKLISRWLDAFAPRLLQVMAGTHASSLVAARSRAISGPGQPAATPPRRLLCLVDCGPAVPGTRPRIWAALSDGPDEADEAAWRDLFRQHSGRPTGLLYDTQAQEVAAVSVWGTGPARLRGHASGGALLWLGESPDTDVTGRAMPTGLRNAAGDAARAVRDADRLVRRLANRAARVRTADRANVLVGLMALEVSGLATRDSIAAIMRGW